jgi:ribonuclease BN (tRNA processing enzyme)
LYETQNHRNNKEYFSYYELLIHCLLYKNISTDTEGEMIKITALGTNGWFDTQTGSTTCMMIQTSEYTIVLDAGYGITKIKQLVDFSKPAYIFLSHLHLDHIIGLHTLDYVKFELPLTIVAPLQGKKALLEILRPPYTTDWKRVPYEVKVLEAEEIASSGFPFQVKALPLIHAVPDTGYRFEIEGKVIAFLLDTGYCENAVALAKDADFVITECGMLPGDVQPGWPHMNPEVAAKLAVDSGARQMLLIHFGAGAYDTIEKRQHAVDTGRSIYPNLIMGLDNMEFIL